MGGRFRLSELFTERCAGTEAIASPLEEFPLFQTANWWPHISTGLRCWLELAAAVAFPDVGCLAALLPGGLPRTGPCDPCFTVTVLCVLALCACPVSRGTDSLYMLSHLLLITIRKARHCYSLFDI